MSSTSESANTHAVRFEAGVTIQSVGAARDLLLPALNGGGAVTLFIDQVAECDLTLVQLVEAARRMATRDGVRLQLAAPATGELRAMLERGGFLSEPAPESRDFWLNGGFQ